ncbi:hypothetical protein GQ54DRAFT_87310 [Martensiomyces pterosporus]|nr:hypothetical protein GQ54DRAFT_87310 [Martensiomyces pterosporus]
MKFVDFPWLVSTLTWLALVASNTILFLPSSHAWIGPVSTMLSVCVSLCFLSEQKRSLKLLNWWKVVLLSSRLRDPALYIAGLRRSS